MMKRRREDCKESVANECHRECQLWTEKYKSRNCSEVIGNKKAVNKLKLWLEDWRKTIDYKSECVNLSNGDDCDQYLDDSKTCVLITGPTGCGKTSMVYAIAEECKFHVLEINGSMKRNGRIVSKMVLEATQSHHMKRCSNPLFPSININHNKSDDCVVIEPIIDHKKVNNSNNNSNTKKKSKKVKKDNGLLKYFSVKQNDKTSSNKSNDKVIEVIDISENVSQTNGEHNECSQTNGVSQNSLQTTVVQKSLTITSNSLILFDDVDIMLDDNINGFWSAVNKINEITKIPVILTATQHIPYIKSCVNHLQVLSLDVPDLKESSTALSSIFAKESNNKHYVVKPKVYEMIANTFSNDLRRCVNELQFDSQKWLNTRTQSVTDKCDGNKMKLTSYYDTLIFSDIIENEFNLLSYKENRDLWMKCVPNVANDDSHTIGLAKDIVFSMNKLMSRKDRHSNTLPIKEPSYVEALSKYVSVTTDKKSLHLDYCPYLSYMCEYESIRRSLVANHSRRSRRFMHHFDSVGLYISDTAKSKLISCFDPIHDFDVKIEDEDDDSSATEIDSSTDIDSSAEIENGVSND